MTWRKAVRERKVFQWGAAYLAGAWLLLQVMEVLGDVLALTPAFQLGTLIALAFGLVLTLVLAWYHGERGLQRVTGVELVILAGVLAAAGLALSLVRPSWEPSAGSGDVARAEPDPSSIAVLPFLDLSDTGDQEYFGDGIAEELLGTIAQIPGVVVAARTSSFAFKRSPFELPEIGRRLGVAKVVEGSVRKSGDRLRIEARLINVSDGYQEWQRRFDAELSDIFAVQEEIARAIAGQLRVQLTETADELRLLGQTDDYEAQDLYLEGRFEWNRRTRASLERAVDRFRAALIRDPDYARALAGLADAYAVLGFYDYRRPDEAFPLARDAASRALKLAPGLPEPQATVGYVALYYEHDWDAAEAAFLQAIQLNPDYPVAHQWYANDLVAMGRFEDAEAAARRASELDPLSMIAHAVIGWTRLYARDYDGAIAQLEETRSRDPGFELADLWLGAAHTMRGDHDAAIDATERAVQRSGGSAITRAALGYVYARAGRQSDARALLAELEAEGETGYVPSFEIAKIHVSLDEPDRAADWLERADREHSHSMSFLAVDPQLAPLAGEARYLRLIERLGLAAALERATR